MVKKSAKPKKRPPPKRSGPEPETLKLEGDWEKAVREGMKRPPPKAKKRKK